jgi:hypothetical protein
MKRKFILAISLLAGIYLHAQRVTYDTAFSGWNVRVTYDPSADSTEGIIFMAGLGEVGTDASKMQLYGPHYWLNNGWDGSVPMGNGIHYPILITIQQLYANSQPTWIKPTIDGILARYKIKRRALHMMGFSNGNMCLSGFVTYQPAANDYSYMSLVRSIVDIQGQNPVNRYGSTLVYPDKFGHWAKKFGGKFLGFEQTGDTRNIKNIINNMNDSLPGSAFFLWTTFGGSGHSNFNDFMDPTQNNWTLTNPEVQLRKPNNASGYYSIPIEGGINVYQWMLRQGDTSLSAPLPNIPPTANAGSDITITLPVDSVQLAGSGTDLDGSIVAYSWAKASGGAATIADASSAITKVYGLQQGTYEFVLTVTDDSSATATDTVLVNVLPADTVAMSKTINVNIYGTSNPYLPSQWNNWTVTNGAAKVSPAFYYSDSSASSVYATLSYSNGINDNYNGYGAGATMAPAEVLRYTSYSSANRTLTLSGLSATKEYTVELYASRRTDGNPTIFTVSGTSDTVNTYYNTSDAAVFSGLSADPSGNLVISIGKINAYTYINGFRIIESVPSARSRIIPAVVKQQSPVDQDKENVGLSLFPNPAGNEIFIDFTNADKGTFSVSIFNISGKTEKLVSLSKEAGRYRNSIDITQLPAGTFMMVIQTANGRLVRQFVKK